jgi:hypothetical protein
VPSRHPISTTTMWRSSKNETAAPAWFIIPPAATSPPSPKITHRRRRHAAARGYLYRRHRLRLFNRTLSETVAGAASQQEYESEDSHNTHVLIPPQPSCLADYRGFTPSRDGRPKVFRRCATESGPRSRKLRNVLSVVSRTSPTVFKPATANTFRRRVGNRTSTIWVSSGNSGVGSIRCRWVISPRPSKPTVAYLQR